MSEIKLLPCPFCGGEAYLYEDEKHNAYVVGCKNCCDVEPITKVCKSKEEAIEKWNQRKPMQEILEKLEEKKNRPPELEYRHLNFEEAIEIVKEVGGMND